MIGEFGTPASGHSAQTGTVLHVLAHGQPREQCFRRLKHDAPIDAGGRSITGLLAMRIWPPEGTKPAIAFNSVDLPQPLGPSRQMNSPAAMSRSMRGDDLVCRRGSGLPDGVRWMSRTSCRSGL